MQQEMCNIEKLASTIKLGKSIICRPEVGRKALTYRISLIEEAVYTLYALQDTEEEAELADKIFLCWNRYLNLRHKLAMSGIRIPIGESKKLKLYDDAMDDAIQEGIIGLIDAATRFDPSKKFRFSTYCRWWVKAKMTRFRTESRTIRPGNNVAIRILAMKKVMSELDKLGKDWNHTVLSDILGVDTSTILHYLEIDTLTGGVVSIDDAVHNNIGQPTRTTILDTVKDEVTPRQDEVIAKGEITEAVTDALNVLSDEHSSVLMMRYGIGTRVHTQAEIGLMYNVTKARIGQIEKIALKAMGLRITKSRVKELLSEIIEHE